MWQQFDSWLFLAGLGLVLFGMSQLEHALRHLAGERLQYWLRQSTARPGLAVLVGTLLTALLQSSSMVGLLILAFVGAGLLPVVNAIGLVLGTNLGTTSTGWLIAWMGFRFSLSALALPLIAFGSLAFTLLNVSRSWHELFRLLLSIGLILLGLAEIKASLEGMAQQMDLTQSASLALSSFLAAGLLFTVLVQSSSATMMVTLSALSAGIMDLPAAAVTMIGANLGTTMTLILASIKGSQAKRKVAFAHVMFNLLTALLVWPQLHWLLSWLTSQTSDPLYQLVLFHTLFNSLGIVLFLPSFPLLSRWRWLQQPPQEAKESRETVPKVVGTILDQVPVTIPDAAIEACEKAVVQLGYLVIGLSLRSAKITINNQPFFQTDTPKLRFGQRYTQLKQEGGQLLHYLSHLQQQPLLPEQAQRLGALQITVRRWLYSAKAMKDIRKDLAAFARTEHDELLRLRHDFRHQARRFYQHLLQLLSGHPELAEVDFEQLVELVDSQHLARSGQIMHLARSGEVPELEMITLLNVDRELLMSHQSLLDGLQHWLQLAEK